MIKLNDSTIRLFKNVLYGIATIAVIKAFMHLADTYAVESIQYRVSDGWFWHKVGYMFCGVIWAHWAKYVINEWG